MHIEKAEVKISIAERVRTALSPKRIRIGTVNSNRLWYGHRHGEAAALRDNRALTKLEKKDPEAVQVHKVVDVNRELARIQALNDQMIECIDCLEELVTILEDRDSRKEIDSFTAQPGRKSLNDLLVQLRLNR